MASSDDLIQHVYDYFLKTYHDKAANTPAGEFVAFEKAGFSPGCCSGGAADASTALQEISRDADAIPEVDGGVYTPTMRTISFQYANMINLAQPSSPMAIAPFSSCKSQAGKLYNDATSNGELDGPKATFTTPVDWYDLHNAANWTNYSYNSSTQLPAPPPAAPQAPNVRLTWKVLTPEARRELLQGPAQTRAAGTEVFVGARYSGAGGVSRSMISRAPLMAASATQFAVAPAAVEPVVRAQPVTLAARAMVTQLVAQSAPKPVETSAFTLSFEYCVVHLRRPWLSGDFLSMPGWYIPGAQGGEYAAGPPVNTGWFAALPMAFIAIKNLMIGGSWSANDLAAAANSAAFGPFSLTGTSVSQAGILSNAGVQIIAWICRPQPKLPPDSDPSLQQATDKATS